MYLVSMNCNVGRNSFVFKWCLWLIFLEFVPLEHILGQRFQYQLDFWTNDLNESTEYEYFLWSFVSFGFWPAMYHRLFETRCLLLLTCLGRGDQFLLFQLWWLIWACGMLVVEVLLLWYWDMTEWALLSKAVISFNTALFTDGKQCNVFDLCSVIPDLAP